MAINTQTLIKLLGTTAYASLSDTDAATLASTSTVKPRALITIDTLNLSTVWGFAKTSANLATLNAVVGAGQATALAVQQSGAAPTTAQAAAIASGGAAANLIALISGPGLNPADPQVTTSLAGLVAAGLFSQADATTALYMTTYPAGDVVQPADVTAARATMAANAQLVPLRTQVAAGSNAAMAMLANGSAVPTAAALIAAFTAKVTGG